MVSQANKSGYQRPYKSRSDRRKVDRRRYDENKDNKFLWRVAVGVGFLVMLALGFAIKGMIDRESKIPASHTPVRETM